MRPALASILITVLAAATLGCSGRGTEGSRAAGAVLISPLSESPAAGAVKAPIPGLPPAAPAQPSSSLDLVSFNPQQLEQGHVAIVYLNTPATQALLSFGGQKYPMLQDGARWWAVVGVGAFANTGTAPVSVSYVPAGGIATTASSSIEIVSHAYPVENIDLDAQTSTLLAPDIVNKELAFRTSLYAGFTPQRLWSGAFLRPSQADVGDIYGIARGYNGAPPSSYHTGTDFVAHTGDPVTAAAAGSVVFAGPLQVRGNSVIVDHGAGVFTAYHHLSRIDVNQGDLVTPGQQLGLTGSTGLVTGPHLHWEVLVHGVEVDGLQWLQGTEIGP